MYAYTKALHVIFVVTWFAGLFYIVRLFIYNREAQDKGDPERSILQNQFGIMMKRLWFGITWPSAVITLGLGLYTMFSGNWHRNLTNDAGRWLLVKLFFVFFLYAYHLSLHVIYRQQVVGTFKYSSNQLRVWNEVATVFLLAIVMLAIVKSALSWVWGLAGLVVFVAVLMTAIKIYKRVRMKKSTDIEGSRR